MMEYSYKNLESSGLTIPASLNSLDCNPHMSDPPFHTPSFGDEGFDLQPMLQSNMLHQQPSSGPLLQETPYHHEQVPHHHQMSLHTIEPNSFSSQMYLNNVNEPQANNTAYNNVVNQQNTSYNNQQQLYSPSLQTASSNVLMNHAAQSQQQPQQPTNNGVLMSQQYSTAPAGGTPVPQVTTELCTSEDSDDSIPNASMLSGAPKRPSPEPVDTTRNNKKAKVQKKKKKRDPNEPQKPVSAYALFFRDTQAAIKGQNPNASFGDVSKIVASMWDALDAEHKNVYKKKTEIAKKEYLKALAAYRASLVSKGGSTPPDQQGMSPQQQQNSPPHQQALQQHQQQQVYYSQQYQPQQAPAYGYQPNVMASTSLQEQQQPPQQAQQHQPTQSSQSPQQLMPGNTLPSINEITQHNYLQPNPLYNPMQGPPPVQACIRAGCPNPAISNAEWQDEYCSNECVVSHCRDVFSSWVASNQQQNYSTVK